MIAIFRWHGMKIQTPKSTFPPIKTSLIGNLLKQPMCLLLRSHTATSEVVRQQSCSTSTSDESATRWESIETWSLCPCDFAQGAFEQQRPKTLNVSFVWTVETGRKIKLKKLYNCLFNQHVKVLWNLWSEACYFESLCQRYTKQRHVLIVFYDTSCGICPFLI